jgi:preprotein translocase subunit YajC
MAIYILILVAMVALMFFMTRRQRQEQARQTALQQGLKVGDRVVTVSGLYGTVVDLDDASVDLEIAEDVVTTWLRGAIREVRADDAGHDTAADGDEAPAVAAGDAAAGDEVSDNTPEEQAPEHPGIETSDPDKE